MESSLDLDHLRSWIGRSETAAETLCQVILDRYRATLGPWLAPTGPEHAPLGFHWCLTQPLAAQEELGPDGHPLRGRFLPPVPLPSRMWAGGELELFEPMPARGRVERSSTIRDVVAKSGRSGPLLFVVVEHRFSADDRPILREIHNIVYRSGKPAAKAERPGECRPAERPEMRLLPDAVLLFRYSALTFNGHRIHYDHPYATGTEGYPGLVVHGPLQATLLVNLAARMAGRMPARFRYRALAPLFAGHSVTFHHAGSRAAGRVWCGYEEGVTTMAGSYSC